MAAPVLLESRPPAARAVLLVVVPAVFGAITGVAVGLSAIAYLVLNVLAVIGGVLAGLEHESARAGALRGLVGGVTFGASILLAHWLSGAAAEVELPSPAGILVVITGLVGTALGALGGLIRGRRAAR